MPSTRLRGLKSPTIHSLQLILWWYRPWLNEMDTASIQVILPCTFFVELLGGTGERGHGWAVLSIHNFCFDFITITIWLVGAAVELQT